MSLNLARLSTEQFLAKLSAEFAFIESHLLNGMDELSKEKFNFYKGIFQKIQTEVDQIKPPNSSNTFSIVHIYAEFLHTVKRFKRVQDNLVKYQQRDLDAFRKRYEKLNKPLVPLIHDIKMNVQERIAKFDISNLKNPNFQMHLYTNKELCEIAFKITDYQGIYKQDQTNLTPEHIKALIKTISLKYNVVPYHNFTHAFSVFQMLFCLYEASSSWREYVQPFEFFCASIASLGHDLNHKGLGNLYKVKRESRVNVEYCELGVLENMHTSQLFQILQGQNEDGFNYFAALKDQNKVQQFKRIIVSCILATDMSKHSKVTQKLKKRAASSMNLAKVNNVLKEANSMEKPEDKNKNEIANLSPSELDKELAFKKENFEDRRFLLNALVHACDIGNPCLEFNNYMNWCYLITQEFSDQTLKEEKYNLPVTGFLLYKDKLTFLNGQLYFCKSMVLPIWEEIGNFFPELNTYPKAIKDNLEQIETKKNKLNQQPTHA